MALRTYVLKNALFLYSYILILSLWTFIYLLLLLQEYLYIIYLLGLFRDQAPIIDLQDGKDQDLFKYMYYCLTPRCLDLQCEEPTDHILLSHYFTPTHIINAIFWNVL